MSTVNDPRIPERHCDALDDAMPCICGGLACYRPPGRKADVSRLECSNARCGRLVPIGDFRTIEEAVHIWNREIQIEDCDSHSWFRSPNDNPACKPTFKCAHCPAVLGVDA